MTEPEHPKKHHHWKAMPEPMADLMECTRCKAWARIDADRDIIESTCSNKEELIVLDPKDK